MLVRSRVCPARSVPAIRLLSFVDVGCGVGGLRKVTLARAGDVLDNPVTGQRLVFLNTTAESDGSLLEVESVWTRPSATRPPAHYHPHQEERFEILSGTLHARIDGRPRTLRAGEVFAIPPGVPHQMWSEDDGEVRANWQTRPAMKTESFFETIWGLANEGKTNEKGAPNLLQAAVIAREYGEEFRLVKPPRSVQMILFGVLSPLARLLGYKAAYSRYSR